MFAYESYRKQALGLDSLKQDAVPSSNDKKGTSPPLRPHVQKGRIKKTPRVMRMFQVSPKKACMSVLECNSCFL